MKCLRWFTHRLILTGMAIGLATSAPSLAQSSGTVSAPMAAPVSAAPVSAAPVSAAPVSAAPVSAAPVSTSPVDDPRISRSRGVEGGVVVLWPRIISVNSTNTITPAMQQVAFKLQQRMIALVTRVAPGRPIDVRPDPERTCPMGGCLGASFGVLLMASETGCAPVALISAPGQSVTRLVPWAGNIQLSASFVPFRAPPESSSSVKDFVPCDALLESLGALEPAVEQALKSVLPTK